MCDLPRVLLELSGLSEVFGQGFLVGAGVVLSAIPIRLILGSVKSMFL